MRKRSLLVMALAGVMIASCACGTTESADSGATVVTEQKTEVKTEEVKKEETTTAQATTEAAKDKDSASAFSLSRPHSASYAASDRSRNIRKQSRSAFRFQSLRPVYQ